MGLLQKLSVGLDLLDLVDVREIRDVGILVELII
jgi:hypothetical protein